MSTSPKSIIQLYQVALAIGNSYNLKEMISESLAGYQKYLDCNACAVLQYKMMLEGDFYRIDEIVEPNGKTLKDLFPIDFDFLPRHLSTANLKELWKKMPVCFNLIEDGCIYVMSLPDFGFILLRKTNGTYTPEELLAIGELNLKLAKCALQCKVSDELTECLTKYDNLINLIPEMIFETDIKGNLLFTNDVAKKVMGLEEGLQSGVVYNVFDFIHKKDIARAKSNLQKVLTTDHVSPREYMLTTTRGEIMETLFYTSRIVDKGKVVGIRGVVLDITERKSIEKKISEKSEKLEMVLLGSDAGLWDWNVLSDEFFFNDRWSTMLGYEPTEITPNKEVWANLLHPEDRELFKTEINKLLVGEIPFITTELRIKSKDGGYKWINESARIVERDVFGNVVRVIGTHIDITDAKLTQDTLKNSLLQQELISGIAISLNSLENFDDKINLALKAIGEHLNVSRVYVFQDSEDGDKTSNTNEWCNKGIRSEKDLLQNVHYSTIPSWRKIIEDRGMLFCDDTTTLPNDIRKLTDAENILSIIEYPLYTEGKYAGFIGFDECVQKREWTKWELELLKTITGIIANAIERRKIDIVLKNSYATNKAIIDSLPDRLLHVTNNGILINFNRVECDFCSNVEIKVGEHIYNILPLEGVKIIEEGIQACVGQGSIIREAKFEKDGDDLYFEFRFSESADKTVIILARNITNRRRSEESIRYNEIKFRELFELMPLGMAFNDFETGQYIDCNQELLNQLGYSRQELMAQSFWNISPNKYIKSEGQQLKRLLKTGRYGPFEKELIRRDGSSYPVELAGFITKDRNGRNLFCSSIKDLTSDKQHIANLQQSEEKFRELFELSPIGLVFCDIETGAFLDCNENIIKQTGYTRSEFLLLTLWDITPAEYSNHNSKSFETLKKTGKYGPIEKEYLRKDGSRYPISVSGFLTKDKSGKHVVCANIQDISTLKKNEFDLRRSEEKFRNFVENASDIILSTSLQGHTLYVSPNITKMLGYSQEEFMKMPLHQYVNSEDLQNYFKLIKDYQIRGIPSENMEYRMLNKNGEWRWVQVTTSVNRDSNGNLYSISILRDFTKDKLAQEQLKRLSLVASKSTNAIVITDKDKRITWINDAFSSLTGYTFDEVIGQNPGKILQGSGTSIQDIDIINNGLKSGKPFHSEIYNYTKTGRGYWIEIYFTPIYDVNNHITSHIAVENDITERKNNEEQIIKLTKGIENSPTIVVITDKEGKIEYVNNRFVEITGYTMAEVLGKTPRILKSGFQSRKVYENLWNTIISGDNWKGELYNMKKDGSYYWELATISPILNANNEITHFIAIKEDITERKKLYEEVLVALEKAERATRAKSEFLATMSHEIRTPMNGVIGMTSLLAKTPLTDEQLDFVNTIRNSGDALLSIINDILDFSKIESGRMEMDTYPFDVRLCVEDVIDLFWIKAKQKSISLNYTVSPTINRQLLGDVTRLRQVLVNLVGNAIKFTEKGYVKISIIQLDEDKTSKSIKLCFKIEDSGLGIAEDKIVKLFSPFSQIDSSITRRFGGTGLGLAITKRLVELMGGSIKVESTENVGSCFSFEISLKYSDLEDASAGGRSFASLNIFEDIADQSVGITLNNLLKALGVAVVQSEQAASVIFTDKETYQLSTTPAIFLKNMDCKIDEENSYFTIITLPLKIASLKNGLQKMFVKPHPIILKAAVDMSEETLAQRVPISILVAEDNTINQKLMNKSLSFYGYTADIAANGLEVIQALERQPYDLIFMDLQMPEMDGLEATKQIVSRYKDSRPVIVAMTASALGIDKEACFEAGMDDYVSKPIKIDVIEEMIVKWCGGGNVHS